jgi:hypothetical protein
MLKRSASVAMFLIIVGAFFFILVVCGGCGEHVVEKSVPQPVPTPSPTSTATPTPGGKPTFDEMKKLMKDYCAACHSTATFYTGNEATLRSSRVKDYLWSRRMPPASAALALPDEVRNRMVTFF